MTPAIRAAASGDDDREAAKATAGLLTWYGKHGRRLGFRDTRDPWAILVSEVMLQQTQVSRVEGAWDGFMATFPTPRDLAEAAPAAVLRAWAGLGYNRRAINLQRAARAICASHGGRVPPAVADLQRLPGVGGYTARAVAAIGFGVPVAAIDTNVRRVLGRVLVGHGWSGDTGAPMHMGELQGRADGLVDHRTPAAWTHAMMDIGATICRPRTPDCATCPLSEGCRYARAAERRSGDGDAPLEGPTASAGAAGTATEPRRGGVASSGPPRAAPAAPFPATRRWLRGRIIDRLRSADDGGWVRLDEPIGSHGSADVASAIVALERDGLLERGPDGRVRLPSTTA